MDDDLDADLDADVLYKVQAQLPKSLKIQHSLHDTVNFHSCNHQTWLAYQILVKNVQINPQTTCDMFEKDKRDMSESVTSI